MSPQTSSNNLVEPGDVLGGRYRIDALLGRGGMASVYRATHLTLGQEVAIKIVAPITRELPGMVDRFLQEARAAMQLRNEHVVRVFDVGTTTDGAFFIVMELLEGSDLHKIVDANGPLPVDIAVDYMLQACEALAEAHGVGIVHRDLKPGNLFLTQGANGRPCIKLIDFGVSKLDRPIESRLTAPGVVLGSPGYMSPEQMRGETDILPPSDVWALGAILYELLCGNKPFEGSNLRAIYLASTTNSPIPVSTLRDDMPAELDTVIARCLHPDPLERFDDVASLARALASFGGPEASEHAREVGLVLDAARARGPLKPTSGAHRKLEAPRPVDTLKVEADPFTTGDDDPRPRLVDQVTPRKKSSGFGLVMGIAGVLFLGLCGVSYLQGRDIASKTTTTAAEVPPSSAASAAPPASTEPEPIPSATTAAAPTAAAPTAAAPTTPTAAAPTSAAPTAAAPTAAAPTATATTAATPTATTSVTASASPTPRVTPPPEPTGAKEPSLPAPTPLETAEPREEPAPPIPAAPDPFSDPT